MYIIEYNYLYKDSNKKTKKRTLRRSKKYPIACSIKICFPLRRLYLLVELLLSVSYYDCLVEYFLWFEFLSSYLLIVIYIYIYITDRIRASRNLLTCYLGPNLA